MRLEDVTFVGPPIDDPEVLGLLPPELAGLLAGQNGFVQFRGGLHVRGACRGPAWHSLREAWLGRAPSTATTPRSAPVTSRSRRTAWATSSCCARAGSGGWRARLARSRRW